MYLVLEDCFACIPEFPCISAVLLIPFLRIFVRFATYSKYWKLPIVKYPLLGSLVPINMWVMWPMLNEQVVGMGTEVKTLSNWRSIAKSTHGTRRRGIGNQFVQEDMVQLDSLRFSWWRGPTFFIYPQSTTFGRDHGTIHISKWQSILQRQHNYFLGHRSNKRPSSNMCAYRSIPSSKLPVPQQREMDGNPQNGTEVVF